MKVKLKGHIVDDEFGAWLDEVGEDNVCPSKVAKAVNDANEAGEPLEVDFSSMGGSVYSASEICAELRKVEHGTSATLSGLIASAGATIACSFDKVSMYDYSEFMIHNPRVSVMFATLRPQELKEMYDSLETSTQSLVNVYCQRTGLDEATMREYLNNETFFTANEAKELGFVDEVIPIVSASVSEMPNISYTEMWNSSTEKYETLLNQYKGANMPENKLVEEGVVEEATTETTEETAVTETSEECGEDCDCHKQTEETATETPAEPTMSDVLSAIQKLTEAVTANVVKPADEAKPADEKSTETNVVTEPKVEDMYHVDNKGNDVSKQTSTPKLNHNGLDVSFTII